MNLFIFYGYTGTNFTRFQLYSGSQNKPENFKK